jgi:hypothetical protein
MCPHCAPLASTPHHHDDLPRRSVSAHGLLYPAAVRLRTCSRKRSQVAACSRLLGLSSREPAIPLAYALAQPRPFNAELSATGGIALQARVLITASLLCLSKVSLRYSWEQDGLLICAISSDDAVALVVLMISPQDSHGLPFSRDLG